MDQNTFHNGAQTAVVLHKFTFGKMLSGSRIFSWNPKLNLCSCLNSKLLLFKQLWSRMRRFSRFYGFTCLSPTANFAQPRCFSSKFWLTSRFSDTESFDKLPSLVNAVRCLFYRSYETLFSGSVFRWFQNPRFQCHRGGSMLHPPATACPNSIFLPLFTL
jgi:hypothetical protein